MTSSRPYLIRALYQWIVDNGMTPYILVDAESPDLVIPREFVQEGKIVLNIAPMAVQNLILADDMISFNARFSGDSMDLLIIVDSVLAVYAKENGQGMMFGEESNGDHPTDPSSPTISKNSKPKKPTLRVVK
ncbi:MAG: ClpXP protease specificity-enhancing factor [Gammaproteobacteria bacterium]|nr:ClpXP protease specificity-enhancing factor [Gammaproteobacteria bacterium]